MIIGNAKVFVDGAFQNASVIIENGKIVRIGKDIAAEGATVIDASGKCVTPGFVDPHSHIGGFGPGNEQDLNEMTNPLTPDMDAYYGIDPASDDFKVALQQGITTSCLAPGSANIVAGCVLVVGLFIWLFDFFASVVITGLIGLAQ